MPAAHLTATAAWPTATAHLPNPCGTCMGLDALPHAVPAQVVALEPAGNAQQREVLMRLMEIGFLPGESVRVVARGLAGLGPLAVRIGQATFALRRHEAALVRVQTLAATA